MWPIAKDVGQILLEKRANLLGVTWHGSDTVRQEHGKMSLPLPCRFQQECVRPGFVGGLMHLPSSEFRLGKPIF
jgi:hypothetical protein